MTIINRDEFLSLKLPKDERYLLYRAPKFVQEAVQQQANANTFSQELLQSDLVSGEYEGGLKIWEGAIDLCNYLSRDLSSSMPSCSTALEIGCGCGLPGILILRKYSNSSACFQDYNREAIDSSTIPNLSANFSWGDVQHRCQFLTGSWKELQGKLQSKFDVIVSSETIYNVDYYESLHSLMCTLNQQGKIYLAAKQFYFGLSGSVPAWLKFVEEKGVFSHRVVWTSDTPVQRVIIEMLYK